MVGTRTWKQKVFIFWGEISCLGHGHTVACGETFPGFPAVLLLDSQKLPFPGKDHQFLRGALVQHRQHRLLALHGQVVLLPGQFTLGVSALCQPVVEQYWPNDDPAKRRRIELAFASQ